jgi:hypothetical protein
MLGVEMRSLMSLARMELNGVGFDLEESERQRQLLVDRLTELEEEAYALAGHPFSLTSPEEICQVLYRELRLPVNGEPGRRWLGTATRSGGGRKGGAPSSSKEVLIKLKGNHKLPGVILDWRKLNMAISKVRKAKGSDESLMSDLLPHQLMALFFRRCIPCNKRKSLILGWKRTVSTRGATHSPPPVVSLFTNPTFKTSHGTFIFPVD